MNDQDRDELIKALMEEVNNMGIFIAFHNGIQCRKCGAYHQRMHICYRCGYDSSAIDSDNDEEVEII